MVSYIPAQSNPNKVIIGRLALSTVIPVILIGLLETVEEPDLLHTKVELPPLSQGGGCISLDKTKLCCQFICPVNCSELPIEDIVFSSCCTHFSLQELIPLYVHDCCYVDVFKFAFKFYVQWATFLDNEGRVMDSEALRKRIFYGGVEHKLRREVCICNMQELTLC